MLRHNPDQKQRVSRYSTLSGRIATLLNIFSDGKPHKAAELAQIIGVNSRTIRRTLHLMRDELGLPLETSREGFLLRDVRGIDLAQKGIPMNASVAPVDGIAQPNGTRFWASKNTSNATLIERN